jgi:hypothetical protein
MNEHQAQIVVEAKRVVAEIYINRVSPLFVFHNFGHTQQVANAAAEINNYYQLNDLDQFILFISAWFHDAGFSSGHSEGHERESIKLASDFLRQHNVDSEIRLQVSSCIRATQIPQSPLNLTEKIMCDADLYHLGTSGFQKWSDSLRQEIQNCLKSNITDEEWRQGNIKFLMSHNYFTCYCREKLEPVKKGWIKQLQNKQGTLT